MTLSPYAKFILAAVGAGLFALYAALTDGAITAQEGVGIVIAAGTAVGVWAVPNKPSGA